MSTAHDVSDERAASGHRQAAAGNVRRRGTAQVNNNKRTSVFSFFLSITFNPVTTCIRYIERGTCLSRGDGEISIHINIIDRKKTYFFKIYFEVMFRSIRNLATGNELLYSFSQFCLQCALDMSDVAHVYDTRTDEFLLCVYS